MALSTTPSKHVPPSVAPPFDLEHPREDGVDGEVREPGVDRTGIGNASICSPTVDVARVGSAGVRHTRIREARVVIPGVERAGVDRPVGCASVRRAGVTVASIVCARGEVATDDHVFGALAGQHDDTEEPR